MSQKIKNRVFFFYESPWPFLVFTACLFLTLGAVLFLDSFYFLDTEVQLCMMGWFGFASKVVNVVRKTAITHIGGYSGILVNNYGTKPGNFVYGKVVYSPQNYENASIRMLDDLAMSYTQGDQEKIYDIWRIVMCNPDGIFSKNYGKLCNTINCMTDEYNIQALPNKKVTEKGFFEHFCLTVNEKSFSQNPKDQFNNMLETSQMEIANRKAQGEIEFQRNMFSDQIEGIDNLGLQSNNDCIVTLKYDKNTGGIHLGYVDCKKLDEVSFRQKLEVLRSDGFGLKPLEGTRAIFGCNLYLVAKDGPDLFLDQKEKETVLNFIHLMAKENPSFFKDYQNSPEFKEFQSTSNLVVLSTSVYPFPKISTSIDMRKYLRFKPLDDKEIYAKYLDSHKHNKNSILSNYIDITENDD